MSLSKKSAPSIKKVASTKSKDLKVTDASRFSTLGAPSQASQTSRKGKQAWRKNVDIGEIEAGLEEIREEERITGGPIKKLADSELFTIDLTGDEKLRQRVKSKKPLTSHLILAQRSAVPAVSSRKVQEKRKDNITRAEKERLLRIGKKKRVGAGNVQVDPTELGQGSALLEVSEAAKQSGTYDAWMDVDQDGDPVDELVPSIKKKPVKQRTVPLRDMITAPAIAEPHQGISYNPPVDAYKQLIEDAVSIEQKRVAEEEKYKAIKATMEAARRDVLMNEVPSAEGMIVDVPGDEDPAQEKVDDVVEESAVPTKVARRKTQQQRRKALRLLQEQREAKEKAARKRLVVTLDQIKALKKIVEQARNEQDRVAAERKLERMERLRKGLVGKRLGKHKVEEGDIDVQLGEDLSDSLRGMKVEGNLFRDRFLSMQNRALVEPRTRVFPTRRRTKVKEMEKFAWKRFT